MQDNWKYRYGFIFWCVLWVSKLKAWIKFITESDKANTDRRFKAAHDYPMDWQNPKTLNQKIQWLKLNDRKEEYKIYGDKWAVRDWVKSEVGEEYLIPVHFVIDKPSDLDPDNLPDTPFIIKANHDSGSFQIVRDKSEIDWQTMQRRCQKWLSRNYYWADREWQYDGIPRKILIEKLLVTESGHIPNDYKFNVFGGKVEFIYVSVDREGTNKRNIYDASWEPLNFTWAAKKKDHTTMRGDEIDPPANLTKMIQIAEHLGSFFPYVRVDLYEVDGKIFFGEITQHQGGGYDRMLPYEWDIKWGELIKLPT